MEKIIAALSLKFGLPESTVRSAIGILLNFIKQKASGSQFEQFVSKLPGSAAVMASVPASATAAAAGETATPASSGGLLGGLLQKAGGLLGGAAEAATALNKAGIPLDKAAPLASEFLQQAKSVAGDEAVASLLENIPALKAFLRE